MTKTRTLAAALLLAAVPLAQASGTASSTSVSVADSLATSVGQLSGSVSQSVRNSSKSSDNTVAQGDYRVERVAARDDGRHDVVLQPEAGTAAEGGLTLHVSDAALQAGRLAPGQRVRAEARPYGVLLLRHDEAATAAFLLLLHDDWMSELRSVPL